ncbi:MAG: hypothetical protein E6J87_20645 [Deltaproteobacteria bacterium]|nr:MAG: hypothetical protein E6J87_20645 [Deltaproteobacteria bacterium]
MERASDVPRGRSSTAIATASPSSPGSRAADREPAGLPEPRARVEHEVQDQEIELARRHQHAAGARVEIERHLHRGRRQQAPGDLEIAQRRIHGDPPAQRDPAATRVEDCVRDAAREREEVEARRSRHLR